MTHRFGLRRPWLWVLPALILISNPSPAAGIDTVEEMEQIFNDFYRIPLDLDTAYSVEDYRLRKDVMTFHLQEGVLFLTKPLNGEITGAHFVGKGRARMKPPVKMDRDQLAKYTGSETLDVEFTELILRFSDGTGSLLQKLPKGEIGDLPMPRERIQARFADRMGMIYRLPFVDFEMDYLESRTSGLKGRDFFVAEIKTEDFGPINFGYNDQDRLEVYLARLERVGTLWRPYIWCNFHKRADYDDQGHYAADLMEDDKEILDVLHHDMKVDIQNLKTVDVDARLTIIPLEEDLRGIRLSLRNNLDPAGDWERDFLSLRVMAVTDPGGDPLPYIHKRHQLLVLLPEALSAGEEYQLRVQVHEETVQQLTKESFSLLNTWAWYPQYGYLGGRATFEWEVKVPKPYRSTGSGRMIREWEEKGSNCSLWRSEISVQLPSVIFGRFLRESGTYESSTNGQKVNLHVHAFPTMTSPITDPLLIDFLGLNGPGTFELTVPAKKMEDMLEEAKQILKLFEHIYGPFPYNELDIAQMAPQFGFGQAPPGLVQLTGAAFMSQAQLESDFLHAFLSHEIAHQWWGHVIGWYDDEDVWLSESFAEYSSGLYLQALLGEKRFQQQLKEWRKRAKIADPVAPIAAANRVSGDTASRDGTYLLYSKGPLVVHMLHMQIGDENYRKAMRALMENHRHSNIKTETLQHEVEKVVGYRMDWFFDQWFRDTGIPKVRFRHTVEPAEDGQFLFTGHFTQSEEDFKYLFLPIYFHFSKGEVGTWEARIREPEQTVRVKLPQKPRKVTVDEHNFLLAEVIYEK